MSTVVSSDSTPPAAEPKWDSAAVDLVIRVPAVAPQTQCNVAFRLLEQNPQWPALAVIDSTGQIAGLVARSQCLSILSKPLMLDLYSKRPVERIMHSSPLTVDIGESIDSVLERIADDASDALVNGFIVTEMGAYVGVATAQDLLVKSVEQARHRSKALDIARCRAEDANLAKSRFLANLSHEIRTPLNGVLANLELLGLTLADAEQSELIGSAAVAAQALFEIIGDVLDLSKIEAGKLTVEAIDMLPAALLQEVATLVSTQAAQRDLSFSCHLSPDAVGAVRGDPTRLRQVLMNLCGNALKFTKVGGLFLSLFRDVDAQGEYGLWIEIADTGVGFDSSKVERLFEAFTQEDDSTTRRFGGTGLGLSICRRLVELMGGRIEAEGEVGGGATFWCRIPFPQLERAALPPADITGLSILVVDGNRGRAERLAGGLISCGASTSVTVSAAAAIKVLDTEGLHFDIVILVPPDDGSGLEAMAEFLAGRATAPVLVTELENVGLRRLGFCCGIRHWTVFSAGLDDLRTAIAAAANRIRWTSSRSSSADMTVLTESLAQYRSARILVIDDTPMNRQVARRQLAKLGFECDLADNGRSGLGQATTESYAVILSDIQMPEMDGYAFIRHLRDWEAAEGRHRTPVIAMTANAMGGDDRKCIDAGMDDYIAKPVKIERLAATLVRWLSDSDPVESDNLIALTTICDKPCLPSAAINLALLSDQLGDSSPETHREIMDMFLEFYPPLEESLVAAVEAKNLSAVKMSAHTAKGAACNAAASDLADLLQQIEAVAAPAEWIEIAALCERAREEFVRVQAFAAEFGEFGATDNYEARRVPA